MKILLWPGYIAMQDLGIGSPQLVALMKEHNIQLEEVRWNAELGTIPTDQPCIVRLSSRMSHQEWANLNAHCNEHGHFCFYEDFLIGSDGKKSSEPMIPAAIEFFKRNGLIP